MASATRRRPRRSTSSTHLSTLSPSAPAGRNPTSPPSAPTSSTTSTRRRRAWKSPSSTGGCSAPSPELCWPPSDLFTSKKTWAGDWDMESPPLDWSCLWLYSTLGLHCTGTRREWISFRPGIYSGCPSSPSPTGKLRSPATRRSSMSLTLSTILVPESAKSSTLQYLGNIIICQEFINNELEQYYTYSFFLLYCLNYILTR